MCTPNRNRWQPNERTCRWGRHPVGRERSECCPGSRSSWGCWSWGCETRLKCRLIIRFHQTNKLVHIWLYFYWQLKNNFLTIIFFLEKQRRFCFWNCNKFYQKIKNCMENVLNSKIYIFCSGLRVWASRQTKYLICTEEAA
jgi:hypothetical protein